MLMLFMLTSFLDHIVTILALTGQRMFVWDKYSNKA